MIRARNEGFTLIEVMLVIGILLVLATVGVVVYSKVMPNANHDAAKLLVDQTCDAIEMYHTKMGVYPTNDEGLKALCEPPSDEKLVEKWNSGGPFLKDAKIPVDPWGQELQYKLVKEPGSSDATAAPSAGPDYRVWSNGPDKQPDTDDDIKNYSDSSEAK